MPIISQIERKTMKGRFGLSAIYLFLLLGAVTTVYPFMLMVRRTTIDEVDRNSLKPYPEFWFSRDQTARKYLNGQYSLASRQIPWIYDSFSKPLPDGSQVQKWESFGQADASAAMAEFKTDFWREYFSPLEKVPREKMAARVKDYEEFAGLADPWFLQILFTYRPGRNFTNQWIQFYLAEKEGSSPKNYRYFESLKPQWNRRDWFPEFDSSTDKWQGWLKNGLKPSELYVYSSDSIWGSYLKGRYKGNISRLNESHKASYRSFASGPHFTSTPPSGENTALKKDWEDFVINHYPLLWQKLTNDAIERNNSNWLRWLAENKNIRSTADWTKMTGLPATSEKDLYLPASMPRSDVGARMWCEFVSKNLRWDERVIYSSEEQFSAMMIGKYSTLEKLNSSWGSDFHSWEEVRPPRIECDYWTLTEYMNGIKYELSISNFRKVGKALILEGNAAVNTAIIIILSLLTALTVNPIAAYALSRFRLRATNRILVFILATMALPAEVAMVPSFLLVKDLGLINSYWALILPGTANAFSIFLLKGFFDSLPAELYEAAMLDGAGEFRMFFSITIPLSMPIISVKILNTVMAAYNLFIPAVIYISNQDMWPVSTKIYEINQVSGGAEGMAALVIASLFPFVVFFLCQRQIMKGIIIPSFK